MRKISLLISALITLSLSSQTTHIGKITVDLQNHRISFPARVNMKEGLVEYLLCTRWGKLHESVLATDIHPTNLQTALLLIGLKPGGGLSYQGDTAQPKGDKVIIWVEWWEEGKQKRYRGEKLVWNKKEEKPLPEMEWVFTGSVHHEKWGFMAERTGVIIATYRDPIAIINNPLPSGTDDTILFSNKKILPSPGKEVKVIIERVKK